MRHSTLLFSLLAFFGWLIPFISISQPVIPRFETISVEQGLSQSSVYSIYQDKAGRIWFGTSDGLSRYDGDDVRTFKIKNPSLAITNSNHVRGKLCEDRSGNIWYANESGIYYFDPVTEQIIKAFDLLPTDDEAITYYSGIMIDKSETFWLMDPLNGFIRYSISSGSVQRIPLPFQLEDTEFALNHEPIGGLIFFQISDRNGCLKFNIESAEYEWILNELPELTIRSGKKKLFLLQGRRLSYFDSTVQKIQAYQFEAGSNIRSVIEDDFGRIWIGSDNSGLYCYFPDSKATISYASDKSKIGTLPFNNTTMLVIDNTDNLWIGTDGGGVARLDIKHPRFNIFPRNKGDFTTLKDYFIRAIYEDKSGRIWLGSLHSGLTIYDPVKNLIYNYPIKSGEMEFLPGNTVTAIFQDKHGTTFIGHDGGISIFDEKRNLFYHITLTKGTTKPELGRGINKITEASNGDILASSDLFGIIKIVKNVAGKYEASYLRGPKSGITDLAIMENGIWFSSRIEGLCYIKGDVPGNPVLKSFFKRVDIHSLHVDELNREILWVSTGMGLIKFNTHTEEYIHYDESDGLLGSYVYGVLEDANHDLWMSTNTGLYFFERSTETFKNFTFNDGLQSNEFNTGAYHKGISGTLYFGGINGINWFKTGAEKITPKPPRVGIHTVLCNEIPVKRDSAFAISKSLVFPYSQNDIVFGVAVFDYTRPEANRIKYKLEGWDKNWIFSTVKSVRYSNLPPDKYTFRVRAANSSDSWGDEEIIHVEILSPFWKTRLFYGLLVFVVMSGVIGVTRSISRRKLNAKLRELEKQQAVMQERERIRKDIHDDLGSGLSKIAILSELAKQNLAPDEFTKRQLEKISEASRELIDNLGELIWANNPANDTLSRFFWYLREHLGGIFEGSNMEFTINLPERIPDTLVQAEWRRNILLIVKESLHNALKHAQATKVLVDVLIVNKALHITITDNGMGFDTQKNTQGNGLHNIASRTRECNGTLRIHSIPGDGTKIELIIPLN